MLRRGGKGGDRPGVARYGRSFFGEIQSRLQRFLDVDGLVDVDVDPLNVTPVVLVGDASAPGFSFLARRWSSAPATLGNSGAAVVANTTGSVITSFIVAAVTGTPMVVWAQVMSPAQVTAAFPGLVGVSNVPWAERRASATDFAPVADAVVALGGVAIPTTASHIITLSTADTIVVPTEIFIQPGAGFRVNAVGALADVAVSFQGRVLG